jgi:hypothetical protein
MTSDDWRLEIVFRDDGIADALKDELDSNGLRHELSTAFHDRVIVSHEGSTIFLYAGDREQAEKARTLVESYAEHEKEELSVEFTRWHPLALEWRPADEPLPDDVEAEAAEHQARIAAERKECEEQGYPDWEIRVSLPAFHEASEWAARFRAEGLPTVHRWRHLLIGAADEDQAKEIAKRLKSELPAGNDVAVEGDLREIEHSMPPSPFWFLGGLGN